MISYLKSARNFIFLIPLIGFMLYSCDKVEAPYATVKQQPGHDTTDTSTYVRKVLLEDYTGHTCPNCPQGTQIGQTLQSNSGEKVIMIAVHAGYFSNPLAEPFTADYRTPEGNAWNDEFGFQAYPNGLVNRKTFEDKMIISPPEWGEAIDSIMIIPPDAGITITCSADTVSRIVTADISTKFLNQLEGNYNITLCVLEDGIISAQKNSIAAVGPTPIIYDYRYEDMLRKTVTSTWGDLLAINPATGSKVTSHFTFSLESHVIIRNASLVAFISNAETKEVIQAEKKKIISE